jgi:hypothetical protein
MLAKKDINEMFLLLQTVCGKKYIQYTKIVGGKNEKILQLRLEGGRGDETSVPLLSSHVLCRSVDEGGFFLRYEHELVM